MNIVASNDGKLRELKNQIIGQHSYRRFNNDSRRWEYLGYGGSNESMWSNDGRYFERISADKLTGATFGKQLLHLKTVCWMNPWAEVEGIPADATKLVLPSAKCRTVCDAIVMLQLWAGVVNP